METQQKINQLETRQLELLAIMASSDAHEKKCGKLGLKFNEAYPEEFKEYKAANAEYNANEAELAQLQEQLANEGPDEPTEPVDQPAEE